MNGSFLAWGVDHHREMDDRVDMEPADQLADDRQPGIGVGEVHPLDHAHGVNAGDDDGRGQDERDHPRQREARGGARAAVLAPGPPQKLREVVRARQRSLDGGAREGEEHPRKRRD